VLDSPKELRPGMTADVDIVVVERKDELLLPIEAVKSEQASTALLTVSNVSQLKVGQSVELESERGAKFQGTVSKLISDNKEGNVEVTLASAKKGIRPGNTTFKLTVNGNTIPDIPAVVRSGKESYVMLMPKGKGKDTAGSEAVKGIRTLIEVGEQNNAEIEILSGLNAGDQVIIPSPTVPEAEQPQRRR
jgi:multidrug efflux pump subunit AcrA (membrane-fusion protein)